MNYQSQPLEEKKEVVSPNAPSSESMVIVGVLGDEGSRESNGPEGVTEHNQTMLSDVTSVQQHPASRHNDHGSDIVIDGSMETLDVPNLTPIATHTGKKKKGSLTRGDRKM